jgi:hypothetical protein
MEGTILLQDFSLKRRRAMFHLDALRDSLQSFSDRNRLSIRGERDPERSRYVFRVMPEPIVPEWALLGDFVYERRASLDYLITALIRSAGNQESTTSQFPIYGIDRIHWTEIERRWERDRGGAI